MSETPSKKSKKANKDEKDKGKDSKKKDLEKKKSDGLSPNSKGKYSDETSKSPSSGKKKTKVLKSKDKRLDSSRIEDSTPKKNIKDKEKKKIKIKDKKKKSKIKETSKEKLAVSIKEKPKVSKSATSPKQAKNRKLTNTAPINNENENENDYDYSTGSQGYSDASQASNYDDNYSTSENENGNENRGSYANEEYSDDSHEAMSYNENEASDFVQALNSIPDFERKIKFHVMPETVPLIPTSKAIQDGSGEEIGVSGGQFDLLGKDITKKNDERGFKINTFPLKNIFSSSEDNDINSAFHIDIIDNDSQDGIVSNMDNDDQNNDLNDDIEFEDDISILPPSMQISLRAMRSCFSQLSDVLTDASESTKIYFQVAGLPNEKLEKDFRSIEKDRSNLIHERQFKQFTKCDVIGTVSSIIKL